MKNLRLTKATGGRGRIVPAAAAIAVVAAAALLPAQGAAAPAPPHHPGPRQVRLDRGTLRVVGTQADDAIALRLEAGNPDVVQVDLGDDGTADFSFPRTQIDRIRINGHAGDDQLRIDDSNGKFTDTIPTTIEGGPGNDTIAGGAGQETLLGGPGNDRIDGNGGNDTADLGAGNDTFVWDPGDGSDTIEGGLGTDAMIFNGAGTAETVDLSANGNHLRFFRSPANITMDTHGVESVDFNALGGADTVTVNDLSQTDVRNVNVDLAGTLGGTAGDGQVDRVVVGGTSANDAITAAGNTSGVTVSAAGTQVSIQHQEPTDQLFVEALGGNDSIDATGLAAGAITEFLDGGDGNDTIAGGPGAETLLGGNGNDTIDGNGGSDRAALGAGDDTFVWDPGDGSDTIEGQDGRDTMVFNGAAGADTVDLSANGDRLRFFRNPGNVTMDTAGVEFVDFNALGGADNVTVNDLTGTDVTSVALDLAGTLGGTTGDGQTDRVVVNGTNGTDAATVAGAAGAVSVTGLAPTLELLHADATDQLDFENFAAGDTLASGGLAANTIQLLLDGIPV